MAGLEDEWALHRSYRPEEGPPRFAPGERAVAKRIGACTVRAVDGDAADVLPDGGDVARVPLRTLVRVHERGHVVCAETSEFRVLAATQLRADDMVVEIGASYGRSTVILAKACRRVIGIDTSLEAVSAARKQYPQLEFLQFDVIEQTHLLAELVAQEKCTVAFVDIGGNRELEALLRLLPIVHRVLQPRLVCIKSRELYRAADVHAVAHGGLSRGARVPGAREWWATCIANDALQQPAKAAKRYHNQGCEREGGSRFTQYPLAYVPAIGPDGRKICRFHNYGVCTRGESCGYDHRHCHRCLSEGHLAKNCPLALPDGQEAGLGSSEAVEPARRRQRSGEGPGGAMAVATSRTGLQPQAAAALARDSAGPTSFPSHHHGLVSE